MVAITDHHDICIAEYVRLANSDTNDFIFFPGMEITCSDNAQCLVLLDPSCGPDFYAKVLGTLTNTMPASSRDDKTCEIRPIPDTITQFYTKILQDSFLREHCIVLPHFGNPDNSHKSLNELGHAHRFATLGCDGVYIERPLTSLDAVTQKKIRGEIPDWGNRRRALVPTGDNRSDTWDRLGKHDCWIKIGEHSIEGLRQALLADEARVAHSLPREPSDRLTSMTVQSSLCGSDPVTIRFNPGFNAIIGGRGSGKSAILEYLRFGLGRTANDLPSEESAKPRERSASLIEDTLSDGYVEITLERSGISETWKRTLRTRETITVKDVAGAEATITLSDAQQRFPARAFDQKGLSSTMNDQVSAADQITGIAAAEELEQRREIDQDITASKRAVTLGLQQIAAYWQLKLDAQRKGSIARENQVRANAVAERLKTEGISEDAIAVIDQAPTYAAGAAYIQSLEASITSTQSAIDDLYSEALTDTDEISPPRDLPLIADLRQEVVKARALLQNKLAESTGILNDITSKKDFAKLEFGLERREFSEKYNAAILEQTKHKEIIDENARLTAAVAASAKEQRDADRAAKDASSAVNFLADARSELASHLARRRAILADAAAKVADHSSHTLKARAKSDPAPDEYVKSIAALLVGSRISDVTDKCSSWIADILRADPINGWKSVCDQVLALYEAKLLAGSPPEPGKVLIEQISNFMLGGAKLTPHAATRAYQLLSDEIVGNILSARSRDFIVLTYVDAQGRSIPFEKASEGQQASALLELLLRQAAGTLLIDQPEDDLDNNVVMRIVELVRMSKSHRQLIFATHNPNIVVNGDADKILALASASINPDPRVVAAKISIHADGAIETPDVKNAITEIMEGGEKAFDLRRRKYRFGSTAS